MPNDQNAFDELGERSTTPGFGSGDFADWWEPDEDDGEQLIGVIVEMHAEPQDWVEPGDVPNDIYTVLSLGRGDHEEGDLFTPRQHKQLQRGLAGAGLGDLVNLEFTGYEKVQGNMMHTYEVGYIPQAEWQDMGNSKEIQAVVDDHRANNGIWGDNTRDEPYETIASGQSDGGSGGGDDGAVDYMKQIVEMQGGEIPVEKADKLLNDINSYDVDAGETAVLAGFEVVDGVIS